MKANKENTNGKTDTSDQKSLNGITNNNSKKSGSISESVSNLVQKPSLEVSKDIPKSNESQNVSFFYNIFTAEMNLDLKNHILSYLHIQNET